MIVAMLNQKGGVGKTTLALHLAGAWARQGCRVTVIDADPQGSALDWSVRAIRCIGKPQKSRAASTMW
jgi:chromosome partitioning protein